MTASHHLLDQVRGREGINGDRTGGELYRAIIQRIDQLLQVGFLFSFSAETLLLLGREVRWEHRGQRQSVLGQRALPFPAR